MIENDSYRRQSVYSSPGARAPLYECLPADPAVLLRAVRDLVIHRGENGLFGYEIPADRLHDDAETRYVDDILGIIVGRDPAPLTRRRDPEDRFVGVCRDLSLLFCSFLRHQGVPARLRSGFATYFDAGGFRCDHVVVEYRTAGGGWLLADPQLADPEIIAVDFDPLDVPRDRFLVAGDAWRAIRAGGADPDGFGIGDLKGLWFVAGNLRLDLAFLNKAETLLWDIWGPGPGPGEPFTEDLLARYDELAERLADPGGAEAAFTGDLRTPATVLSLAPFNGPAEVTLRA